MDQRPENNTALENIYSRKSVRLFEKRPVSEPDRAAILRAALEAPSPANMSLYTIIEITDQELKNRTASLCYGQAFIGEAPMVLLFAADFKKWNDFFHIYAPDSRTPGLGDMMLAWEDSYIAMQNAVTAAWALGIGSCYIGHVIEHYEETRELFGLPDYVVPTGLLVFGYPTEKQLAREKFSHFQWEDMVCENRYREKSPEEFRTMLEERQKKSGKDFDTWAKKFTELKWQGDFREEMGRSVRAMMDAWLKGRPY